MSNKCDDPKLTALSQFLSIDEDDISEESNGEYSVGHGRNSEEYLVLTDKEADEKAKENISEELWAFTPSFIEDVTGVRGIAGLLKAAENKCESLNDSISDIVEHTCGIDKFVEEAIAGDGRGHFLAQYDDEEHEVKTCNETYYIYRTN